MLIALETAPALDWQLNPELDSSWRLAVLGPPNPKVLEKGLRG